MRIAASEISLAASHVAVERREVRESLRMWIGDRPPGAVAAAPISPAASAQVAISPQARSASAPAASERSAAAAPDGELAGDPLLMLLRTLLRRMFGIEVEVFDESALRSDIAAAEASGNEIGDIARRVEGGGAGFGIEYDYHERRSEEEMTRFAAEGVVVTADGREIAFRLNLEMARSWSEQIDVSIRAGDAARKKDPLVINFSGNAAALADQRFAIDLDGDGRDEDAHFVAAGSGFLVFDRNLDGKVNDRSELFGPATGDGFAELARHDADGNGWIDENDEVFTRLRVWSLAPDGGKRLQGLAETGVGAVSLARLATPFSLKDSANALRGEVVSSGVFLREDGSAGTVQQVDLVV